MNYKLHSSFLSLCILLFFTTFNFLALAQARDRHAKESSRKAVKRRRVAKEEEEEDESSAGEDKQENAEETEDDDDEEQEQTNDEAEAEVAASEPDESPEPTKPKGGKKQVEAAEESNEEERPSRPSKKKKLKRRKKKRKRGKEEEEEEANESEDTAPEAESDEENANAAEARKAEVLKEHGKIGVTISMGNKKESPTLKVSTSPDDTSSSRQSKHSPSSSGPLTPSSGHEKHHHHHRHRHKSDKTNGDEFITRSSEYWRKLNPMVDQILVTDVTSGATTVTIRECATREGFFANAGPQNVGKSEEAKPNV